MQTLYTYFPTNFSDYSTSHCILLCCTVTIRLFDPPPDLYSNPRFAIPSVAIFLWTRAISWPSPGFIFGLFQRFACRLTYGCNPACPRPPFWRCRVWVGSNCHCGSAAFISPAECAGCPVSHVSMTFTEDCCIPLLLALVALPGVSLGGWLDREPNKNAGGEVKI